MSVAHGRQLLRGGQRFQMFCQCVDDFSQSSPFEPLLLGFAPALWCLWSARQGSGCQILADVKIVAKKGALRAEDFSRLQTNPFGSIAERMHLTVEPPTCAAGAMTPAPTHFIHIAKGGGIDRFGLARRLGCRQTYFFPIPRLFALSRSGCYRAHHAPVGLGNHV